MTDNGGWIAEAYSPRPGGSGKLAAGSWQLAVGSWQLAVGKKEDAVLATAFLVLSLERRQKPKTGWQLAVGRSH